LRGDQCSAGWFYAAGGELNIAEYSDGRSKVAVVGIKTGQQPTSITFAPDEWHASVALWPEARGTHAAIWQTGGAP